MADQERNLLELVPHRIVSAWAKYAIEHFQESLKKHKIGITQNLFNSFKRQLEMNGGDVEAVMIKFAMYGRFRDMGVGRGVKAYERKSNKANLIANKRYGADVSYTSRQPKRWYSRLRTAESLRLQEILIQDLGKRIPAWLGEQWSDQSN